jgi:hypothetical protein
MQTLVTDSGHRVSKCLDVLNEQNKLYSSLYSNKEAEDNLNVHLVDNVFPGIAEIPKLNENEKESCDVMISLEEYVKLSNQCRMENHQELMVFQSNLRNVLEKH